MKVTALVRGAMIHFFHRYEQQMKPAFIFSHTTSICLGSANAYGLQGYWINDVINSLAIALTVAVAYNQLQADQSWTRAGLVREGGVGAVCGHMYLILMYGTATLTTQAG